MARPERILKAKAACGAWLGALVVLLTGCSRHSAASHTNDVIAVVNGREITVGQVEAAANEMGTNSRTLLESLIDQELLMQSALSKHLDQDPTVMEEMEHARREILARAYERSVLPQTEVSEPQTQAYYRSHPALFAHRRVYRTLTFNIAKEDLTQTLRGALDQTASAMSVRQLLDRRSISFEAVEMTRAAEEIPANLLPQLTQAARGDVLVAAPPQGARALLICVVGVKVSPIDFNHAQQQIRQYLADARNHEILAQYLHRARSVGNVSYAGPVGSSKLQAAAFD
jgi:EpsD family peptidyl-prolyl cis-trans isomerase